MKEVDLFRSLFFCFLAFPKPIFKNEIIKRNCLEEGKDMSKRKATLAQKTAWCEAIASHFQLTTFTAAAAMEMRERLAGALATEGYDINKEVLPVMTLNAIYMNLIKKYYKDLGFSTIPRVLDVNPVKQAKKVVNLITGDNIIRGLNYNIPIEMNMGNKGAQGALIVSLRVFDLIKTNDIDPNSPDALDLLRDIVLEEGLSKKAPDEALVDLLARYESYARILKEESLITFSDQEIMGMKLLKMHPEFISECDIEHVVVDEFQDSNDANMEYLRILEANRVEHGGKIKSIMVIGDDAQSIYGFRKACPENMVDFDNRIGEDVPVTHLYMSKNYRSYEEIINPANELIKLNENRVEKELVAAKGAGGVYSVSAYESADESYETIAKEIYKIIKGDSDVDETGDFTVDQDVIDNYDWNKSIAVITFTKKTLGKISAVLSKYNIPWVMMAPIKIIENSRVRAAIKLTDAFFDPDASQSYFEYLVALYDGKIFEELDDAEIEAAISNLRAEFVNIEELEPTVALQKYHEWLEAISHDDEIYEQWLQMLKNEEEAEATKISNEDETVNLDAVRLSAAVTFVKDFVRFGADTEAKMNQQYNGVALVTAHSSKGLEYDIVFNEISDYDSMFLENPRNIDEREERRRLLYVSMTRAIERLFVTGVYVTNSDAEKGDTYNQFLRELYTIRDGDTKTWEAEILAMKQRQAERELEKKAEAAKKAREKRQAAAAAKQAAIEKTLCKSASGGTYKSKIKEGKARTSGTMTPEQIAAYNKLVANSKQTSIDDYMAAFD